MQVTVSGGSDDLIEVEGDLSEEFNWIDSDGMGYLAFGDGTLLSVKYDGFWRFHVLRKGTAEVTKVEGTNEDTDYSDKVTLVGDVAFVVFGTDVARGR